MSKLDVEPYAWPDPEVLRSAGKGVMEKEEGKKRVNLPTERRTMISAAIASDTPDGRVPLPTTVTNQQPQPSSSPTKPNSSSSTSPILDVWHGRRIFLSSDLRLSPERRETVESALVRAGAVIVPLGPLGYSVRPATVQRSEGVDGEKRVNEGEDGDGDGDEPMSETEEREMEEREREEEEIVDQADVFVTTYRCGKAYIKVRCFSLSPCRAAL